MKSIVIKINNHKNESGLVLVMSLIVITLMLTSVLLFSTSLNKSVQSSINAANSVVAFYAAESGVEKGLHRIKYSKSISDFSSFSGLGSFSLDADKSVTVDQATVSGTDYVAYNLTTSTPSTLDIIDPTGDVSPIAWGSPKQYTVEWEVRDCYPDHSSDKLEISALSFADSFSDTQVDTDVAICGCSSGSDICSTADSTYTDIQNNRYYRFTFRPLDSTVRRLTFSLIDTNDDPMGIFSNATIRTIGNFHKARYYLTAVIPSLDAASDIFSYVVFSEQELRKDL